MLKKFIEMLPENVDGALIISPENRRYFTGFDASDGFLFATKNGSVFLTDSRYIEEAQNKIKCCDSEEIKSKLSEYAERFNCKALAVEADRLTVSQFKALTKSLPEVKLTIDETDELIDAFRAVKTDEEVENICKAQRIAEDAFEYILGEIRVGVTEKEIALKLDYYMLSHGAEALSFETIAISGANTSKPHGVPTNKKIESGDFVTMDYGAVVNGRHSDMTRTVAVGEVSSEQKKIYETVLKAQLSTLEILKSGLKCSDADKAARDIITEAGYGEFFRHSTGHGVGVEIHEKPNLSPKSTATLQVGNVVTIEPGIYIPEKFGVRIEDMALITENGCENLTKAAKELIVL
jgi:Xaa-Pro aminopeptidase